MSFTRLMIPMARASADSCVISPIRTEVVGFFPLYSMLLDVQSCTDATNVNPLCVINQMAYVRAGFSSTYTQQKFLFSLRICYYQTWIACSWIRFQWRQSKPDNGRGVLKSSGYIFWHLTYPCTQKPCLQQFLLSWI